MSEVLLPQNLQSDFMDGYQGLRVWSLALQLCKAAYVLADKLPASEQRGLKDQIRRSSQSVCSNIAEGKSNATAKQYASAVGTARSEANELRAQIEIAVAVGYLCDKEVASTLELADDVSKMLWSLRKRLLDGN